MKTDRNTITLNLFDRNYEDTSFYNTDNNWRRIVKRYSQTQVTFETDKFPALSGLVKAMQKESGDEYIADFRRHPCTRTLDGGLLTTLSLSRQNIELPHGLGLRSMAKYIGVLRIISTMLTLSVC